MKVPTLTALVVALVWASAANAQHASHAVAGRAASGEAAWKLNVEGTCPDHFAGIAWYRGRVWRYERRMEKKPTRPTYAEHKVGSCEAVGTFVVRWRKLAKTRRTQLHVYIKRHTYSYASYGGGVAHYSAWLCIHSHEGSWTDSGDPYWGGLQMDRSFMSSYGSDMIRRYGGYANVWPPMAQMVVAERAYRTRGFSPWPNTARMCGLL